MAELTFRGIVQRQLQLLQHVSETLMSRALAGNRTNLEDLFATQDRLEHWLQYLSPLAMDVGDNGLDAPPPLPGMRPAPPLPHEMPAYQEAMAQHQREMAAWQQDEDGVRPRVQFPPEPLWVEDLERDPGNQLGEP